MINDKRILGDSMLLIASLIWGIGYAAVEFALNAGAGEYFLTASRFTIASILMFPLIYKKLKHANKDVIKKGVVLGLLLFLGFIAQTVGQISTTTTNVAFLTSVNIVLIPFTSFFIIKRKIRARSIIAALITMIGIAFLTLGDKFSINKGDIYVLLCALFFAAYASVTDMSAKKEDPNLLVFVQFVTAAVLSYIAFFLSDETIVLNSTVTWSVVYLGVVSNLIATSLYTHGLKYTSAERASIIVSLESVFGSAFGILIFSEPFTVKLIIGAVLIFIAILYSEKILMKKSLF